MISASLEIFVKSVMTAGKITLIDVQSLHRDVLPDGIGSRDEADILIALDRAIGEKHVAWSAFALTAIVDFVVWQSRPTGTIDGETARWLVASLSAGQGPSGLAEAIAFEVVCEAERVDPALTTFAMRTSRGRFGEVGLGSALPLEV